MDRRDLARLYSQFNLFLFPSLHDSGGMAVVEAMSFGVPVLCLDCGGPGMTVDHSCGFVIPTADRSEEQVVRLMADCLSQLLSNPHHLEPLSNGARHHVESLTWQAVVAKTYGAFTTALLDRRSTIRQG